MSASRIRRSGFTPRLESLEDRCTPASIALQGSTLVVNGTNLSEKIRITIDDARNAVTVVVIDPSGRAVSGTYAASAVRGFSVFGWGGDDQVECRLLSDMTLDHNVALHLGEGNDTAWLDFGLFKSHDVLAKLSVAVFGEGGIDNVRADFGNV